MEKAAIEFGRGLIVLCNLKQGDPVLLVSNNDVDVPVAVLGILWAGGIVSPANPTYTASELAHQIADTGSKSIVVHSAALKATQQACLQLGLTDVKLVGIGSCKQDIKLATPMSSVRICGAANPNLRRPDVHTDDLAFLVYSSGTTGKPKGVMLSHYNIISNILQMTACSACHLSSDGRPASPAPGIANSPTTGDKLLSVLPFFHVYGLTALVLAPLVNGIHCIVLSRFEIGRFCHLIEQHGISFIYLVPPIVLELAKSPAVDRYDLRSVRMTNSGAAPLSKELQQAVFKRTGIRVKQGYGLSETSPSTHEQRWQDWERKAGSIGRLYCNMQAKFCQVQDETASISAGPPPTELPVGEVGELYLKGPNVFSGYWKNSDATAGCLSSDGWFRTGDVGYMDADGDFYITDRAKELIKYKGFQVAPAELEGYLTEHPWIDDVAVVGVMSELQGTEVPRAFIANRGGIKAVRDGDGNQIKEWLAKKVVKYKRLHGGISFVSEIPKSRAGKILRKDLKAQAKRELVEEEATRTPRSKI